MQKVKPGAKSSSRHKILIVRALSAGSVRGRLEWGGRCWPCAIGRAGRHPVKREGDGRTPVGRWRLRQVLYRADRGLPPQTRLALRPIWPFDGWCDDPQDRNYNRPVRHPYPASAEHLFRPDHLYDVIVILECNDTPRVKGRGSAIFMHLAHPGYQPTAGCIAFSERDLKLILARCTRGTVLVVPA